jgi:chromate reductase, NAD(P)H dehydrogenase (quinone)
MRVLGISGSLRQGSHNTELLRAAAKLLPPGTQLELYEGLAGIPPYGEDVEHEPPQAVTELKDAIAAADVVLFSTPEYNHSLPGQLKNALDWVSRPYADNPLIGKPVAVLGASSGMFGAVWAQAELRKVVTAMGGRVTDRESPSPAPRRPSRPTARWRTPPWSRSWRTWSLSCAGSWSPPEAHRFHRVGPDLNGERKQNERHRPAAGELEALRGELRQG